MLKSLLIFSTLLISYSVYAQTDTDSIATLPPGKYNFTKGAVHVSLSDTVAPAFIDQQISALGYEILKEDIFPLRGYFIGEHESQEISRLARHPYVESIQSSNKGWNEDVFQRMVKNQNMSAEDSAAARKRFRSMTSMITNQITFKYYVTEQMAEGFVSANNTIGIKLMMFTPRSVIIRTKVDEERKAMKVLDALPFVTGTSFIALNNAQ